MAFSELASISQTVRRAKAENLNISETALRRWVKNGSLPVVYSGCKALILWDNLVRLLRGEQG